jgi:23S rRNA pseudouridine1911/1915/1917 synthase
VNAPFALRVPPGRAGLRADVFFALTFPFLSRTRLRQKIQQGEALLNGRRFATSARLRAGDEITVAWRGPMPYRDAADEASGAAAPDVRTTPEPVILFEDAWYVAVDKPAGQVSHPSGATQAGTVIQQVRDHLRAATVARMAEGDRDAWPVLANRLDRFTSGIVLVAKTVPALVAIQALREEGLVRRSYRAAVGGLVSHDAGMIDTPIAPVRGGSVGIRMAVSPEGLPSRTAWRVLEREASHTVLEAAPETGRQHQVRVHLASIGHPVIGDLLYPDEGPFLRWWANGCRLDETLPARHLLHARTLSFVHPFTGVDVVIESPVPADFAAMLATLARL